MPLDNLQLAFRAGLDDVLAGVVLLRDEDDALAVLLEPVADFDDGFLAVAFFDALLFDAVALRLFAERALLRAVRTGRFQPAALSARKVVGIEMTLSGLSITEAATASARSARTSEITLAGRRARAAWTRLVSSRTNVCRSGSIQMDVPV